MSDETVLKIQVVESSANSGGPGGIPPQFDRGGIPTNGPAIPPGAGGSNAPGAGGFADLLKDLVGENDDAAQAARNEKLAEAIAKAVKAAQKEAIKQQQEQAKAQAETLRALRHLLVQLPGGSTLLQLADRFNGLNWAAKTVWERFSKLGTVDVLGWLKETGGKLAGMFPKFQGNTESRSVRADEYIPPKPPAASGFAQEPIDAEYTVRPNVSAEGPRKALGRNPDDDIVDVETEPSKPVRGYLPGPERGFQMETPDEKAESNSKLPRLPYRATGLKSSRGIIPAAEGGGELATASAGKEAATALTEFIPAAEGAGTSMLALGGVVAGVAAGLLVAAAALKAGYTKLLSDAERTSRELGKYGAMAQGNAVRDIRQQVYDMQRERRVSSSTNAFLDANQRMDQGLTRLADSIRGPLMETIAPAVVKIAQVVEALAPFVETGVKLGIDNAALFAQIAATISGLPGAAFLMPAMKVVAEQLGVIIDNTAPKKKDGFDLKTVFDLAKMEKLENARTDDVQRNGGPNDTGTGFTF